MTVPSCFQVHPADNVATMLEGGEGMVRVIGSTPHELTLRETIAAGHKVALVPIAFGSPVIKFGVRIGHATAAIRQGAWVHLHNLASDCDQRSGTLDCTTGTPTDNSSAYA